MRVRDQTDALSSNGSDARRALAIVGFIVVVAGSLLFVLSAGSDDVRVEELGTFSTEASISLNIAEPEHEPLDGVEVDRTSEGVFAMKVPGVTSEFEAQLYVRIDEHPCRNHMQPYRGEIRDDRLEIIQDVDPDIAVIQEGGFHVEFACYGASERGSELIVFYNPDDLPSVFEVAAVYD